MSTINQRNKNDKKDCLELGQAAEDGFEEIAGREGWFVYPASKSDNMHNHIDYIIKKGSVTYKVEVKGLKRISRSDTETQDENIWIELKSVNPKNKGWLYGKADLICFEMNNSFKIVERKKLIYIVDKLVNREDKVTSAKNALYKSYSRFGRPDEITMIKTSDLDKIIKFEWRK